MLVGFFHVARHVHHPGKAPAMNTTTGAEDTLEERRRREGPQPPHPRTPALLSWVASNSESAKEKTSNTAGTPLTLLAGFARTRLPCLAEL